MQLNDIAFIESLISYLISVYSDIKVCRGPVHQYLGMTMTVYSDKIELSMEKSIDSILADRGISTARACPSKGDLFSVDPNSSLLDQQKAKAFHTFVARVLYVTRKVRMDLSAIASFLSSRVQQPTEEDDKKLTKLLQYLFDLTYVPILTRHTEFTLWTDVVK